MWVIQTVGVAIEIAKNHIKSALGKPLDGAFTLRISHRGCSP